MSMSGLFERLHHLLTAGYPYIAVEHTDAGDYPHITYWDDARLLVVYEVFVADLAAAEDAYRAERYGISLARLALAEADELVEFHVEVKAL